MSDIQDRLQVLFPVNYRSGNILLINADCMEVMKHIRDGEFELSCVDPPYGIQQSQYAGKKAGKQWGTMKAAFGDYTHKKWDAAIPDAEYFAELRRVSRNQIIWGANYMTEHIPASMGWIYWDKNNPNTKYSDGELAYTSFNRALRSFSFTWNGMLQGNMKKKEDRIHPTQKPQMLYSWLLQNYATKGDKILDTHGGSMSSVLACIEQGFDIVCLEIDKEYYELGVKRVEEYQRQQSLFAAEHVAPIQESIL